MPKVLGKVSVPVCGLALGFAALGNLLGSYGGIGISLRWACGALALILLLLFALRLILRFGDFKQDLENPVLFSVLPTSTMTLILLAGYLRPILGAGAFILWAASIALHILILCAFTLKIVLKRNIKTVFPSWFIVFVGFVTASVTAPAMNARPLGQALWIAGFAFYWILLPFVLFRTIKVKGIPDPARPTIAVFAAPLSLCLAGYFAAFEAKSAPLALCIGIAGGLSYLAVLITLVRLARLPFFPSFSSFTFPLVISAVAFKGSAAFFGGSAAAPALTVLAAGSTGIAVLAVLYVTVRYVIFWISE
jgi:exfoliative toxin A/B